MSRPMVPGSGLDDRPRELLVAGHVNVDRFLGVREFPLPDRTVPLVSYRESLGGTATNLALVASGYGVASGLVSRIGDGFPPAFRSRLERAGIDLRGLEHVRGATTPTCFIVEDAEGRQRTLIDQGPMWDAGAARLPGRWLSEYTWLHLTTGDPDFQLRLLARARASGLKIAADPAQEIHYRWDRARFATLLSGAEILFGNRSEIDHAVELVDGSKPASLVDHVPLVVRTEGDHGATAFTRTGTVHVPAAHPRKVVTAVGAGEAFRGGFYAAWFEGEPLRRALVGGARAAARWMERPGREL
jgi:sugar/nucleoside kinase (ribokinase family)